MTSSGGFGPTLSEVRAWDTEHLIAAAGHWTNTATVWEDCFTDLATHISSPGGVPWEGHAAETAQQRAHSDKMTVIALADQLHNATAIARAGEREIAEARRRVLSVVQTAEEAGFTVGDDFSVTDPHYYDRLTAAARRHRAEAIATRLRDTVATLVAADIRVAGDITAATTRLDSTAFAEDAPTPGSVGKTLELVNSVKQDGGSSPAPGTTDATAPLLRPKGEETLFQLWGLEVSKEDAILEAADGVGGLAFDGVRKAALDAIKAGPGTGPDAADPALMKWLEEKKLKLGRLELPLFSRMGGAATAALAVPGVFANHAKGDSWAKSIVRETAAAGAGLAAEGLASAGAESAVVGVLGSLAADSATGAAIGSVVPGAGTAAGLVGGLLFGSVAAIITSNGVGAIWDPAADVVGDVIDDVATMGQSVKTLLGG